jgi:glucose/mannose-6-phosphate isomerase
MKEKFVLDDLKLIHMRDAEDALGKAQKQWEQYKYDFKFSWQPSETIKKVVVSGMGGSGLAAKVYKSWPGIDLPFEIVQDYELPTYIDKNTLLIVSSYSGNTEEEVTSLNTVLSPDYPEDKKPMIVVMTSGGKLQEIANEHNLLNIILPQGYQPRMTLGYQLRALCEIFESGGVSSGTISSLEQAADWLKDKLDLWEPTVPTKNNQAKKLALDIIGKSVVIYASTKFSSVAYKWKISFNENAKSIAWWNQYSEFNHNEFLGWTNLPVEKPYAVIDLRSSLDNPQIQKRFAVSQQLLSGLRPSPEIITLEGDDFIRQILWGIGLGDFVTLYTAILSGIDPTPVDLIEEFKSRLQ